VRLGLRFTRQNGNKAAASQAVGQPTTSQDEDQPAASHAENPPAGVPAGGQAALGQPGGSSAGTQDDGQLAGTTASGTLSPGQASGSWTREVPGGTWSEGPPTASWSPDDPADSQTESIPAVSLPEDATAPEEVPASGDVPAVSHEEYLPAAARAEGEPAGAAAAGAVMGGERTGTEAGDEPAGAVVEEQPADGEAGGHPAGAVVGDEPAGADAGDQTAGPGAGAPLPAEQTAVLSGLARRWGQLALGARIGGLWQRSVGRAWQRTIGRLGISRLWQPGPGVREAADPGVRTLALITAMPVILLVAWLIPGLVLLLVHGFLPAAMVLISVPAAVALTILVARELPGRWPAPGTPDAGSQSTRAPGTDPRNRRRAWPAWWGLAATIAIAVAFAVWQWVENSPQFIVSRDPGAYLQYAYWIANHGRLPIPSSPAAFGGAHPGLAFASFGFATHSGNVIPSLSAGLPIVLSVGVWAHGVTGAVAISPLIGALAILAVGGLTARLAGPHWAPAGALLLALTVPEIYTSRSAFSDTLAQALLFGGLCLVVDSFSSRRRITLASLGGLALGLTVLAGTSFLLVLLPVIVVAGALLAGRRLQAIPLAAGWLAGVICGLAGGLGLDAPALSATTPSFRIIGILAGGLVVLTAAGAAVALVEPARRRAAELLAGRPLRWLPEAGAALVVAAGVGLAIRPYVQKVHGPASLYIAALQRLEGLPVDPGRLYAENTLYWVIWYLGVPTLLLGLAGLAMVTRICLRALITWKDPAGTAQSWVLPVAIIGWGLFAVLWLPATVPDQPWASRQLVPVVLPGLIVLAVWVAAWMIGRAHARGAGRLAVTLATACFVVAMAVPAAAITFGIALSRPADPATRLALSGLAFRTTGAGEVTAVEQLCGAIPQHSSVVLLDKVAARAFAQVIRGTCGVPTGIVAAPGDVPAIIGGIERAGRHPALLATRPAELTPFGAQPRQIVSLTTQQDEHLLTKPPTSTWPVRYTLWLSQPGGTAVGA
jgi:hypothetical protein